MPLDLGHGHGLELVFGDLEYFGEEAWQTWADLPAHPQEDFDPNTISGVPTRYMLVETGERRQDPNSADSPLVPFEEKHEMVLVGFTIYHPRQTPTFVFPHQLYHQVVADPAGPTMHDHGEKVGKVSVTSLDPLTIEEELVCTVPTDVGKKEQVPCGDRGRIVEGRWLPS